MRWRPHRWWIRREQNENRRYIHQMWELVECIEDGEGRWSWQVIETGEKGGEEGMRGGQKGWETASGVGWPLTCGKRRAKMAICWVATAKFTCSPAWESLVVTAGWKMILVNNDFDWLVNSLTGTNNVICCRWCRYVWLLKKNKVHPIIINQ